MARNEIFRDADHLSLPVPSGTVSGDPVKVGGLMGVAQTDRATASNFGGGNPEGNATVWLKGAHVLTVDGAITDVGQPVYFVGDGTSRSAQLSATATDNTLFGHALETKAATAGPIRVRIARV